MEEGQCQRKMNVPNRAASNQAQEVVTRNRVRVEHCRPDVGTEEEGAKGDERGHVDKRKGAGRVKRKGGKGWRRHSFPMGMYSSDRGGRTGKEIMFSYILRTAPKRIQNLRVEKGIGRAKNDGSWTTLGFYWYGDEKA